MQSDWYIQDLTEMHRKAELAQILEYVTTRYMIYLKICPSVSWMMKCAGCLADLRD